MELVTVIEKVRVVSKWIEFCFIDPPEELTESFGDYHLSSKTYKFRSAISEELRDKIDKAWSDENPYAGLIVVWKKESYNYEIERVTEPNQKSMEIEEFKKNIQD